VSGLLLKGHSSLGGIDALTGTLTIDHVNFDHSGLGLRVYAPAQVTVRASAFYDSFGPWAAAIYNQSGTVSVYDSSFYDNIGAFNGGAVYNGGITYIYNSVFYNNNSEGADFYTHGQGGAIANQPTGQLSLSNSTLSANYTGEQAGSAGSALYNAGVLTLTNVTLAHNYSYAYMHPPAHLSAALEMITGSVTTLRNSLLANNTPGGDCANHGGTLIDGGYNLVADNSCGFTGGADPLLAGLADNGGPTLTHALLPGSPAIDAGDPAGCTDPLGRPLVTDQRGYYRTVDGNTDDTARCDIGAFEYLSTVLNLAYRLFLPLALH
jgi:hypothetical protein